MHFRLTVLLGLYALAIASPLLFAWHYFGNPRDILQELGTILGMLAFAMILSEFALSGRMKSFSERVGMDATMRFHRIIGWLALSAALLHPFFYESTPSGGLFPWDSSREFSVTSEFAAIATGVVALVLLPALIVLAVWRSALDYRYEVWRRLHGILAAAIALLLLHHTLEAGRYAMHKNVALLWQVLTVLALLSLVYRYLLVPIRQRNKPWKVSRLERLTDKQWQLCLQPAGHDGLFYKAGQFAWIKVGRSALSIAENPFSIASAPASGSELSFVIKELGDFTSTLSEIEVGTTAYVDGAYGSLTVDGREEPGVVLIAGGVGIAPILGILRQMQQTKDARKLKVIYGNREGSQIVCADELSCVDTTFVVQEPEAGFEGTVGIVDANMLNGCLNSEQLESWLFVLCGPAPMMEAVETYLKVRGVSDDRLLCERFNYD